MNTLEIIKKLGWAEVAKLQKELATNKKTGTVRYIAELSGKIQGMVKILNMIR